MNYKSVISTLILAASSLCTQAYAANDGHLDGYWFKARIKTSIPVAMDWTNPPQQGTRPGKIIKNVKVDSGKDNCYVALAWGGQDKFSYLMLPVCKRIDNGAEVWELSEFIEDTLLLELNDGKSIGFDIAKLYLAQKDKPFHGFPEGKYAYTGYHGTIIFTPTLDKNGQIKTIKAKSNTGFIYSYDNATHIGGTSRSSGLTLKFIKEANVPAGAKCAVGITASCPQ